MLNLCSFAGPCFTTVLGVFVPKNCTMFRKTSDVFIKLCLRWISDCFRFLFETHYITMANMHNVAIAKPPAVLSTTNLGLNLVSDDDDGGFLNDYELEDDD